MRTTVPSSTVPLQLRKWRKHSDAPAWIFGGAVRDLLLGRQPWDWDLVVASTPGVPGTAEAASRDLAAFCQGRWIELNTAFQQYRVLDRQRQYDLQPLPEALEAFLRSRDFSVNALAVALPEGPGASLAVLDPTHGLRDLAAKTLRPLPGSMAADPVRVLRGIRTALELGFRLPARSVAELKLAGRGLWTCAAERIRDELLRILAFWPQRPELVLLALALVLAPAKPARQRLQRLQLRGLDPSHRALLTLAAALERDHAAVGRRLRLSREQIRFLGKWERLSRTPVCDARSWLLELVRSGENPVELSRLAVAAGDSRLRILALRNARFAARIKPPLLGGDETGRLAHASGPALGHLLAAMQVEQALGNLMTKPQTKKWVLTYSEKQVAQRKNSRHS